MFFVLQILLLPTSAYASRDTGVLVSASYYLATGHPTASGQRYNIHDPKIAAGPKSLFGREVLLVQKGTGKSIIVRVIDRMPYEKGRNDNNIDLTPAAFQEFASLKTGRVSLTLYVL